MKTIETKSTKMDNDADLITRMPKPVVLVAHAPLRTASRDRIAVLGPVLAGRSSKCELPLNNPRISGRHCRISNTKEGHFIEDLDSRNGTFVNGVRISGKVSLEDQSVIRIGQVVLVFHEEGAALLTETLIDRYGFAGEFHAASLVNCCCVHGCDSIKSTILCSA